MESITLDESESATILSKLFNNLYELFVESRDSKIKNYTNQFEQISNKTIMYIEKAIGIVSPLEYLDWLEIVFIFIA